MSEPTTTLASPGARSVRRRWLVGGLGAAILLSVAHTANDALTTILAVLLPSIQERYQLGETTLALLVATLWASGSMSQPFVGAVADRLDRRSVAAAGVLVSSALLSLIGIVPTVWLLFALLAVGGLGSAALHPAGAVIARTEGSRRPGLALALFAAGGQLGYAVGPVLVLAVVAHLGLNATPLLMVPGIIIAAAMYVLLPPGQPRRVAVGPKQCLRCLLHGRVATLAGGAVLANLAFVTATSALPLWLVRDHGVAPSAALVGWSLAAFSAGAVAGSVAAGLLSTRVNRVFLTAGTIAASVLPLLALLYLPVGGLAFFGALVLAGGLVYANFPILVMTIQEVSPRSLSAASGVLMGLAPGVAGVIYIGVGKLQELLGMTAALGITFLVQLPAAAIIAAVLLRSAKDGRRTTDPTTNHPEQANAA